MRLVARVPRFADKSRQARLPIQDELTLALVGRVSRSLIKVERPHRRETQGRLCKHKEVEHEPNHIGFLARGCPHHVYLWDGRGKPILCWLCMSARQKCGGQTSDLCQCE